MSNNSSSVSDDNLNTTRFSPITDNDKAGILWIASLLSGIYAVLSLIVRLYIKRKCFGHDDWICLVATVRR
jgi:Gpi18-like mannosyltransferase